MPILKTIAADDDKEFAEQAEDTILWFNDRNKWEQKQQAETDKFIEEMRKKASN